MTRVLVCGGRDYGERPRGVDDRTPGGMSIMRNVWRERDHVGEVLSRLRPLPDVIIHGAAKGADRHAAVWARDWGVDQLPFPAEWYRDGKLDRSAGPRRNQRMLDEGKPDLVIAFPGGTGTADMVRRARAAGIRVMEIGKASE